MEQPSEKNLLSGAMTFWALYKREDVICDENADFATASGNIRKGYIYALGLEKEELNEKLNNAKPHFDYSYAVFTDEMMYRDWRNGIPEYFGLICTGDLYGLGNVILTERRAQKNG
ncbi:MAG: hypothetical protein MJ080_05795 [Clostridia bacterium]|nr:hypothetical protein [Clostridia bacterium]